MFISDDIVFIDLPKCASSHIQRVLKQFLPGRMHGTHVPARASLIGSGREFWSSIRNPWEWYLSLWAYGCDGNGALHSALTTDWGWLRSRGWKNSIPRAIPLLFEQPRRHRREWLEVYADVNDPGRFRAWLTMIHSPECAGDIGDLYARGSLHHFAGLLTYRYLKLCCTGEAWQIDSSAGLAPFENGQCYIDRFIQVERLESDLIGALLSVGIPLTDDQQAALRERRRTNPSPTRQAAGFYYDGGTAGLVADRDQLLVNKFAYTPPMSPG